MASMALAAVGHYRVLGPLTAGHLFFASDKIGKAWREMKSVFASPQSQPQATHFNILTNSGG
jgi:hypothetical protein